MITTYRFHIETVSYASAGRRGTRAASRLARSNTTYPDTSGKVSRGCPELPFDILVDMCVLASDQKELEDFWKPGRNPKAAPVEKATADELNEERKRLTVALTRLQQLAMDVPWADWAHVYDPIRVRLEEVKIEIEKRKAGA